AVDLYNPYGITETCVDVTHWKTPADGQDRPVSIGRPMGNYRTYLLDDLGDPVGVSTTGEICVGGAGLAHGYTGRPRRTAAAFLPDPFVDQPGARLYASGDRGRWSAEGELRYYGRRDRQVQLRGMRVELDEVEAALETAPTVGRACVLPEGGNDGRAESLIAYVVPERGATLDPMALRAHLQTRLRDAVVPGKFVELEEMPTTPSGKVDRAALGEAADGMRRSDRTAPRDELEEIIAEAWCEVLGLQEVGVYENFFSVGGDSIQGIRVVSRIRREGLHLEVRDVVDHQTVAGLARVAGRQPRVQARQETLVGEAPVAPIQQWFFDQQLEEPSHWNQAHLFEVADEVSLEVVREAFGDLLGHHDALRLRFERKASGIRQRYAAPPDDPPVEAFALTDLDGDERG
ncbi:MAG: AMP-binding protein, partial [Bradymonadaceae bacterium]